MICRVSADSIMAAKTLLPKCVIGFVQTPWLLSLNKCAAADLGNLPVVDRIHLSNPAIGSETHVTKTFLPLLQHYAAVDMLLLNYRTLINVCNKLKLSTLAAVLRRVSCHREIISAFSLCEEWCHFGSFVIFSHVGIHESRGRVRAAF